MPHAIRLMACAVLIPVVSVTTAWAQATAQINGTVADSSGGVLPGAVVAAIQTDTGFRREVVTDPTGSYSLTNLPTGPYRLEVVLSGFRAYAQTGIVLQVNGNPVIPVTLQLGAIGETITVTSAIPLVETRNPAVGQVINNEQVQALPLEGRNVASLVVLAGGAVDTGNPSSRSLTQSRGIAVAGGQQFGVQYLLDGAPHNNWYDGVNLPLPFPDAMQEFSVETSSQNAQNGVKAGGTVSVATKAGTNLFHGDMFEFARHHRFNATAPFAAISPATGERTSDGLVRHQFGGVLGGPIVRDRIFFFGAYQGTRATQTPADIVTFIPTAAMLNGDFSTIASAQCRAQGNLALPAALGFVNNRIDPALLSPAAVAISRMLPTTSDPCGQIAYSRPTRPTENQPIARIDWRLNKSHTLFARYMLSTTFWEPAFENANGNILAATLGGRDNTQHSLAIGDSMVLSNTTVNNVRFSVNRTSVVRTHSELFGPEDVGIKMFTYIPNYMNITTTGAFSINTGTETFSFYKPNTYSLSDDLTMVRGNHQFGIGVAAAMSNWQDGVEHSLDGSDLVHRRRHRSAAGRFPARARVRVPGGDAVPAGHQAAVFRALRAGYLAGVVERHAQLRRAVGAMVPAGQHRPVRLQLRRRADAGRDPQHGVPAGAGRPLLSRRSWVPGQFRHEDRVVEHRASGGRVVGPERRRSHVAARRLWLDRRFRDRPVLLRFALGSAVRTRTASHQHARSTIRGARLAGPTRIRSPWAARTIRTAPRCIRSSSRCPTTSRRRATTAGMSHFSSRSATTWRSRRRISATTWSTCGALSMAIRA